LSREGLYKALSPEGNPTFETVSKVAKALGFKLTIQPVT
jgi:probable addiction module antidote protein